MARVGPESGRYFRRDYLTVLLYFRRENRESSPLESQPERKSLLFETTEYSVLTDWQWLAQSLEVIVIGVAHTSLDELPEFESVNRVVL